MNALQDIAIWVVTATGAGVALYRLDPQGCKDLWADVRARFHHESQLAIALREKAAREARGEKRPSWRDEIRDMDRTTVQMAVVDEGARLRAEVLAEGQLVRWERQKEAGWVPGTDGTGLPDEDVHETPAHARDIFGRDGATDTWSPLADYAPTEVEDPNEDPWVRAARLETQADLKALSYVGLWDPCMKLCGETYDALVGNDARVATDALKREVAADTPTQQMAAVDWTAELQKLNQEEEVPA